RCIATRGQILPSSSSVFVTGGGKPIASGSRSKGSDAAAASARAAGADIHRRADLGVPQDDRQPHDIAAEQHVVAPTFLHERGSLTRIIEESSGPKIDGNSRRLN